MKLLFVFGFFLAASLLHAEAPVAEVEEQTAEVKEDASEEAPAPADASQSKHKAHREERKKAPKSKKIPPQAVHALKADQGKGAKEVDPALHFEGGKNEKVYLKKAWDSFLIRPENQKLWHKVKSHQKFKKQRLEFGITRGKWVRLDRVADGEAVTIINGKIMYYQGYEEKFGEEMAEAEKEILLRLERK